jgi:transposase
LNYWQALTRYVENGELGIDNNITERDIRPFTTGRKNWMFAQSVKGAQASAVLYSIVMTCRANDINPYFYFQKLFEALPNRVEGADLSDLLPWHAQFKP